MDLSGVETRPARPKICADHFLLAGSRSLKPLTTMGISKEREALEAVKTRHIETHLMYEIYVYMVVLYVNIGLYTDISYM